MQSRDIFSNFLLTSTTTHSSPFVTVRLFLSHHHQLNKKKKKKLWARHVRPSSVRMLIFLSCKTDVNYTCKKNPFFVLRDLITRQFDPTPKLPPFLSFSSVAVKRKRGIWFLLALLFFACQITFSWRRNLVFFLEQWIIQDSACSKAHCSRETMCKLKSHLK